MFGMSLGHLLILLLVLLIFGAKRLPELGSSLGKGLRAFKRGIEGHDEDEQDRAKLAQQQNQQASQNTSGNQQGQGSNNDPSRKSDAS